MIWKEIKELIEKMDERQLNSPVLYCKKDEPAVNIHIENTSERIYWDDECMFALSESDLDDEDKESKSIGCFLPQGSFFFCIDD